MLVASCDKCKSLNINLVKLHGWNSNDGTFTKECIYCNDCCSMLSTDKITINDMDKHTLVKYVMSQ